MAKYNFRKEGELVLTNNYSEIDRENLEATQWIYNNDKNSKVHYYTSTGIPFHLTGINLLEPLQRDLSNASTLIISGHHPDSHILEFMKKPVHLICYSKTWYPKNLEELVAEGDPADKNKVFWKILEEPDFNKIVKQISYFEEAKDELKTFTNYSDFYEYLIKNK